MLSHIDCELFPDRCEVVVFNDPQRYVYPIFKNGRSALLEHTSKNNCRTLLNQQIHRLDEIEIYLRTPQERFASGINTFCQMTLRDHPGLDTNTVAWFAERYLFLNRHYSTQFSWLVNLARYANSDCVFSLKSVSDLQTLLGIVDPDGISPVSDAQSKRILANTALEMYVRLDQSLVDLVGQKLTWNEICEHIHRNDKDAWIQVIGRIQGILNKCIVQD